jgi:hypothetical protein
MVANSAFEVREFRDDACDLLEGEKVEMIDGMDEKTVLADERDDRTLSGGRKRRSPVLPKLGEAFSFSDSAVSPLVVSSLAGSVDGPAAAGEPFWPANMMNRLENWPVRM